VTSPITASITAPSISVETIPVLPTVVPVTSPPPPVVTAVSKEGKAALIKSLTNRVEVLERAIQKMPQTVQQAATQPSSEHHHMLLRKISELEMKVESQNKVKYSENCVDL
jgi:hypothetical protein